MKRNPSLFYGFDFVFDFDFVGIDLRKQIYEQVQLEDVGDDYKDIPNPKIVHEYNHLKKCGDGGHPYNMISKILCAWKMNLIKLIQPFVRRLLWLNQEHAYVGWGFREKISPSPISAYMLVSLSPSLGISCIFCCLKHMKKTKGEIRKLSDKHEDLGFHSTGEEDYACQLLF